MTLPSAKLDTIAGAGSGRLLTSNLPGLIGFYLRPGPSEEGDMDLQSFLQKKKKKKKKGHAPAPAPGHKHHKKNETTPTPAPAPGHGHHKKNETTPDKQKKAATDTPAAAAVGEHLFTVSVYDLSVCAPRTYYCLKPCQQQLIIARGRMLCLSLLVSLL